MFDWISNIYHIDWWQRWWWHTIFDEIAVTFYRIEIVTQKPSNMHHDKHQPDVRAELDD